VSFHRSNFLKTFAIAAAVALCCAAFSSCGWGQQIPPNPQPAASAPTESKPQAPPQSPPGPRLATAASQQSSLELSGLIAQFSRQLRAGGARDLVVVSGLWPENGKNAFQDWLVAQVKQELAQGADSFHVVQDRTVKGFRSSAIVLSTDGVDTVVSADAFPSPDGILITLNAQPARTDEHEPVRDTSIARVSRAISLTDERTALLPPEWKRQIEEEREEVPKIPWANPATLSKMPTCVSCDDPSYTKLAKRLLVVGNISILLTVETDGTPHDIQLVDGLGFGLDDAAVEKVSHWRFTAALDKQGKPIATRVTIQIAFKLL